MDWYAQGLKARLSDGPIIIRAKVLEPMLSQEFIMLRALIILRFMKDRLPSVDGRKGNQSS